MDISKVQFDKTLIMLGRKNCGFNMFAGVAWLHIPNLSERIAPCKSRKISRSDGRHQTTMQKHGVNQSYRQQININIMYDVSEALLCRKNK